MAGSSSDRLTESLKPFFFPRRIAVVGASREKGSIGARVLDCLRSGGFSGSIIPVNPHADVIDGLPAVPSLLAIPNPIDLAVIAVPAHLALSVIDKCAARLVPAVIMIAAGFAETGERGAGIEQELRTKIQQHGLRLIGPNCFGVMNLDPTIRLNATYTPVLPPFGPVSIASDSGGIGATVIMAAQRLNIGISTYVSLGNHVDVTVNDLLEYWEQDVTTQVILLYLETIPDPRRFRQLAERIGRRKPIIALKAGRTTAGQSAAGSHTAALATNDWAVDALFSQCGVIRVSTLEEWLALAMAFSNHRRPAGRRVGILTNSGGAGVLCADSCEKEGLVVPLLPPSVSATLASFLSPLAAPNNPVDVIGLATEEQHAAATETLLGSDALDALIILYLSINVADNDQAAAGIIRGIRAARLAGSRKPVYLCWMAESDRDRHFTVDGEVIPTYHAPDIPALVIRRLLSYEAWREQSVEDVRLPPARELPQLDVSQAKAVCAKALAERGPGWLTTEEVQALLGTVSVPLLGRLTTDPDEAVQAAETIGYPVAVKLASRHILHKTELGTVCLNLTDGQVVREAFHTIKDRLAQAGKLDLMDGVLVQPMVSGGMEMLVGATRDSHFGPLIAVGLGGIHVELLGDVRFGLAPLTNHDVSRMIRNLNGYPLLTGYRGRPAMDVGGLEDVLIRMSYLVEAIPDISQLDLNPIIVLPDSQGCKVVDARVLVQAPFEH
ncbi:MAG: acetate--CoA ligase family protein [Nitrospira sp.]|nr:acetate--CoA ligase family protein [Nitrospira sp.]